jgi:hypothetical protein
VGAAAAILLISLSVAGTSVSLKDGDLSVSFGRTGNPASVAPAVSAEEINLMVQNAVTKERRKMEEQYSSQLASFKEQLSADNQAKIQAVRAEHQAQLRATQVALQQEIRRFNRQHTSGIRAFFARDDSGDSWGEDR